MKKLLVPVDFSKDSMNAFDHAIFIANKANADLRFIHVRKSKDYDEPFVLKGTESTYGKTVMNFCDQILEEYKPQYTVAKGKIDYVIAHGKIYKAIIEQAKKDRTDLILMGTHGVSGFEEFWVGSNAYRVVCKAPCPVLTIRHGIRRKKIERILIPIDAFRDTRQKVPFTAELAKLFNSEVHVVDFRSSDRADVKKRLKNYTEQTFKYLKNMGVNAVKGSKKGTSLVDAIISYAVANEIQVISIMSNHRGTPVSLGMSTNAQQLVNHSPIPILSVHPKK